MEKLLYLFDRNKDVDRIGEEIASLVTAFDDLEADPSLAMLVCDAAAASGIASVPFAISGLAGGDAAGGAVLSCGIDDLRAGCMRDVEDLEHARAIIVDAGDLGVASGAAIDEMAHDIASAVPACALGRIVVVWSGGDALDQELFVMGRLAALRIAFAKATGEGADEPLFYLDTMGNAKRAASLAVEGMFDGVCCKDADWSPAKFASLAQRIAE